MSVDEGEVVAVVAVPVGAGVGADAGVVGDELSVLDFEGQGEVAVVGELLLEEGDDGGGLVDGVGLGEFESHAEGEVALLLVGGGGAEVAALVADVLEEPSGLGGEVVVGAGAVGAAEPPALGVGIAWLAVEVGSLAVAEVGDGAEGELSEVVEAVGGLGAFAGGGEGGQEHGGEDGDDADDDEQFDEREGPAAAHG